MLPKTEWRQRLRLITNEGNVMEDCKDCEPANMPEPGQVLRYEDGDLYLVVTPRGCYGNVRRLISLKTGNIWNSGSLYGVSDKNEFEVVDCCYKTLD